MTPGNRHSWIGIDLGGTKVAAGRVVEGKLEKEAREAIPPGLKDPQEVVSLMTGLLPTRTGVRDNVSPVVVPDVPLLAETRRDAGFRTSAGRKVRQRVAAGSSSARTG